MTLEAPPAVSAPPALQTAAWLFRPTDFLDRCRRRYGDIFSVKFIGFQTPMVMISDPEAISSLYKSRENGLPPGRSFALESVMGSRSVLLLEGKEHLSRRKLMLPAFHGERMRAYESVISEVARAEIDTWPVGSTFPIHPRMQAVTLEVILRAVFGVSDASRLDRLGGLLGEMLADMASPRLQVRVLAARRFNREDPMQELRRKTQPVDDLLQAEVAERRADPALAERTDILSMLVAARFEDGEQMSDQELRDQLITLLLAGHETTATALAWTFDLLLAQPARADPASGGSRGGQRGLSARRDLRVAAPATGRPARRQAPAFIPASRRLRIARGHRRHPGYLAGPHPRRHLSRAAGVSPRALPRGLTRRPTRGFPLAAAFAAAWALRSRSSRCGSSFGRCSRAVTFEVPSPRPNASPAATSPSRLATARR